MLATAFVQLFSARNSLLSITNFYTSFCHEQSHELEPREFADPRLPTKQFTNSTILAVYQWLFESSVRMECAVVACTTL